MSYRSMGSEKAPDNDGFLDPNEFNILPVGSLKTRTSAPVIRSGKIVEQHYPPTEHYTPSGTSTMPTANEPSAPIQETTSMQNPTKVIQQRLMNRTGIGSAPAGGSTNEHKNYQVHYTSFYGLDVNKDIPSMQVYTGEDKVGEEANVGVAVDPRFAYLYKGFKPQKGTKFTKRKGMNFVQNANSKKVEAERPAFIGAPPPEKSSDVPKFRHERYLKMSREKEEDSSVNPHDSVTCDDSDEQFVVWDQRSRAPEHIVESSLGSSFRQVMKEANVTSEQRIQNLITSIKSTLSKLLVPGTDFQFYVESYLGKMIKEKGWKSLTTSSALFLTVAASQARSPPDPPHAMFKCMLCQLSYPPDKYQCVPCRQGFTCLPELYVHEFESHGRMTDSHTICMYCSAMFPKNPIALRTHFKVNHCCEFNHLECPFGCKTLILETHTRALPEHVYSLHACLECNDLLSDTLDKHVSMFHTEPNKSTSSPTDYNQYDRDLLESDLSKIKYGSVHKKRAERSPDTDRTMYIERDRSPEVSKKSSRRDEKRRRSPSPDKSSRRKRSRSKSREQPVANTSDSKDDMYEKAKLFIDQMFASGEVATDVNFAEAMDVLGLAAAHVDPRKTKYEDDLKSKYKSKEKSPRPSKTSVGANRKSRLEDEIDELFKPKKQSSRHSSKRSRRRSTSQSPAGADYRGSDEDDRSRVKQIDLKSKKISSNRRSRSGSRSSRRSKSIERITSRSRSRSKSKERKRESKSRNKHRRKSLSRDRKRSKSLKKKKSSERLRSRERERSRGHHRSKSRERKRSPGRNCVRSKSKEYSRKYKKEPMGSNEEVVEIERSKKPGSSLSSGKCKSPSRDLEMSPVSPLTSNEPLADLSTSVHASREETVDDSSVFRILKPTKDEKSLFTKCTQCPLSCPPDGGYTCEECFERFLYFTLFYIHMESEHDKTLPSSKWDWDCEFCGSECRSVSKLHEHLSGHYCNDDHLQCPLNCTTLLTNQVYDKHLREKHDSFHCDDCDIIVAGEKRAHDSVSHKSLAEEMLENTECISDSEMETDFETLGRIPIKLYNGTPESRTFKLWVNKDRSANNQQTTITVSRDLVRKLKSSKDELLSSGLMHCYNCSLIYDPLLMRCDKCRVSFIDSSSLAEHAVKVHKCSMDLVAAECQFCDLSFSSYSDLLLHRLSHFCSEHTECSRGCTSLIVGSPEDVTGHDAIFHRVRTSLVGHVSSDVSKTERHHEEFLCNPNVIKCSQCPMTIHQDFKLSCEFCEDVFFVEDELTLHLINNHSGSDKGFFRCMICVDQPEFTDDINSLIEHRFITHEVCKEHVCCPEGECSALMAAASLDRHVTKECKLSKIVVDEEISVPEPVHTFENPEMRICGDCTLATLTHHLFQCDKCMGIFVVEEEFLAHLQYDHDIKIPEFDFACESCDAHKKPVSAGRWRQHRLEKHKICKTHFSCSNYQCHMVFNSQSKLKQHLKEEVSCNDKPRKIAAKSVGWKYCNLCKVVKLETYERFCPLCPGKNLVFVDDLEFGLHLTFRHKKKVSNVKDNIFCETCGISNVDVLKLGEHRFKSHNTCHKHFFCRRNIDCQFVFSLKDRPQIHDRKICVPPSESAPDGPTVKRMKVVLKVEKTKLSKASKGCKKKSKGDVNHVLNIKSVPTNCAESVGSETLIEASSTPLSSFKLFNCETCNRKFGTSTLLECKKCDQNEEVCTRQFINPDEYSAHCSSTHGVVFSGEYKCNFCISTLQKVYRDPQLLQKHLLSSHGYCSRHWICTVEGCVMLFGEQSQLISHINDINSHKTTRCLINTLV